MRLNEITVLSPGTDVQNSKLAESDLEPRVGTNLGQF